MIARQKRHRNRNKTMINGLCHLCIEPQLLEDSHVWPNFAYRRYSTNPGGGGQFVDLHFQAIRSHQYTRDWFCRGCERSDTVGV